MKSIAVIGIGNILFRDEGIGCYAGTYLESNYRFSQPVDIVDGGTLGFRLMSYYQSYDKVIILDTVSIEDAPGSVYNLPAELLMGLGSYRRTAHEVEVVEMLEICSLLDEVAEVSVIGMVPRDIQSSEIGLTACVQAALPLLIAEVLRELEGAGVTVTKRAEQKPLETVIREYNAPIRAVPL